MQIKKIILGMALCPGEEGRQARQIHQKSRVVPNNKAK